MSAENYDFRKQYTKEEVEFQKKKMEKQKEFGILEYMIWILFICIPFLGTVLGFLYIKFADVEKKPWATYICIGILPYILVFSELLYKKYFQEINF